MRGPNTNRTNDQLTHGDVSIEISRRTWLLSLGGIGAIVGTASIPGWQGVASATSQHETCSMPLEMGKLDTIGDLRALGKFPTLIFVLGYYVRDDGGDGFFFWDATSMLNDNGGTIIKPDAISASSPGRWLRLVGTMLSVRWFGAKGDGVTNDTDAIQAAITAGAGKLVFFPKGTYKIYRSLIVGSAIRLMGETRETSKLLAGADIHILDLRMCFDTFIEHLGFSDNQPSRKQTSKAAIYVNNTTGDSQRIFLRNLLFDQTWQGIVNENNSTYNTFGIRISDVLAVTRDSALVMFFTSNLYVENFEADHAPLPQGMHTALRDIWFYGNSRLGGGLVLNKVITRAAGGFGIVIEGPNIIGEHYGPRFLQVWCWHISADVCGQISNSAGLVLDHVEQVFVEGSYFALNTADNVRVRGNTTDVTFSDCQFIQAKNSSHGLLVEGLVGAFPQGVMVQACLAAENSGDGFKFNEATRFTLANSIARGNGGHGCFTLGQANEYIIQGNNFYHNAAQNLNDRGAGQHKSVTSNLTS